MYKFPKTFLFGAATSAHQVEGNNTNSDWWKWEQKMVKKPNGPKDVSGVACSQWEKFEEDFVLAKNLGHNCHRISIEWAKIELVEGEFNQEAILHYKKVLKSLNDKNIKTFVTLFHFTLPYWFAKKGGFKRTDSPKIFSRYAEYVARELGDYIDFFIPINEPKVYVTQGYLNGTWPPQIKSIRSSIHVFINLVRSHNKAYKKITHINKKYLVGPNQSVPYMIPLNKNSIIDRGISTLGNFLGEFPFYFLTRNYADFISVNHYFYDNVSFKKRKISFSGIILDLKRRDFGYYQIKDTSRDPSIVRSDIGWSLRPRGHYFILKKLKKYNKPIYITESGLADAKDKYRSWYIRRVFYWMNVALNDDIDLRGYMHWSLIDNFEWSLGFSPRFGLCEVERKTLKRKPRESAYVYRDLIKKAQSGDC